MVDPLRLRALLERLDAEVPAYVAMAGFRNLLVHGYAVADDARVIDILHERIPDLARFRRRIAASAARVQTSDAESADGDRQR